MEKVLLPKKLTAENRAKGLLSGEFFETSEITNPEYCGCGKCWYCSENPNVEEILIEKTMVSWTTIKDIYDMIVKNLEIKE